MSDGPNFEKVFQGMKVFHAGDPNDVKIIIRYLRFYKDTDSFELYAKHYLPMLTKEQAKEFKDHEEPVVAEPVVSEAVETVTETVATVLPKKKGRPAKTVSINSAK